ncbi:hypothetical protein ACI1TC_05215 [Lactococcus petauri]|uniref:hypothetical protein n=1 Tax=Lactococcus petauri TaxID=1940789 RepID=UPI00254F7D45|nr:hypothetical protein [Lactococcus petauri]
MSPEKKRKLRNIALLALLGLIGGTFAFAAFNQQAINDRLRENRADYGGRVHDYFNSDSGNKDVFVENFGQEPIIVRLKLSEFMAIQERGGEWQALTPGERENVNTWETYYPEIDDVSQRKSDSELAVLNDYSNLTFGWTRGGEDPPWYLPTFNTVYDDPVTAAAGHARDLSYVRDGEVYPRATHPGNGKDGYWSQGESYTNTGQWPGTTEITRETAQNLSQDRAPITLQQWQTLPFSEEKIGNYWVMDEESGWAYYAIALQPGEATSYLLDAAQMTGRTHNIQGSYYYGIHVTSELIGVGEFDDEGGGDYHGPRFSEEDEAQSALGSLLTLVRRTAFNSPNTHIPDLMLDALFDHIRVGQRFTTGAGEQFMYLGPVAGEEQDGHMIITTRTSKGHPWDQQPTVLAEWYNAVLSSEFKERVLPVVIPEQDAVPGVNAADLEWGAFPGWRPTNLGNWPDVANDLTNINSAGEPQAFALSMADVMRFSSPTPDPRIMLLLPFTTFQSRVAGYDEWWFTRTPADENTAWGIGNGRRGLLGGFAANTREVGGQTGGVRPALIIRAGTVSE